MKKHTKSGASRWGFRSHPDYINLLNNLLRSHNSSERRPIVISNNSPSLNINKPIIEALKQDCGKYNEALKQDSSKNNIICVDGGSISGQLSYRSALLSILNQILYLIKSIDSNSYLNIIAKIPGKYKSLVIDAIPALQDSNEKTQAQTDELIDDSDHVPANETLNRCLTQGLISIAANNKLILIIDNIDQNFSSDGFELVQSLVKDKNICFVLMNQVLEPGESLQKGYNEHLPLFDNPLIQAVGKEHHRKLIHSLSPIIVNLSEIYSILEKKVPKVVWLVEKVSKFTPNEQLILSVMAAFHDYFTPDALIKVCEMSGIAPSKVVERFIERLLRAQLIYQEGDIYKFSNHLAREKYSPRDETTSIKINSGIVTYCMSQIAEFYRGSNQFSCDPYWLIRNICMNNARLQIITLTDLEIALKFSWYMAKVHLIRGGAVEFLNAASLLSEELLHASAHRLSAIHWKVEVVLKKIEALYLADRQDPMITELYAELENFVNSNVTDHEPTRCLNLAKIYLDKAIRDFGQLNVPGFFGHANKTLELCNFYVATKDEEILSSSRMLLVEALSVLGTNISSYWIINSPKINFFLTQFGNDNSYIVDEIIIEALSRLAIANYFLGNMPGFVYYALLAFKQCVASRNPALIGHVLALTLLAFKVAFFIFLYDAYTIQFEQNNLPNVLDRISAYTKKNNLTNAIVCICLRDLCQEPTDIVFRLYQGYIRSLQENDLYNAVMNGGNGVALTTIRGDFDNAIKLANDVLPHAQKILITAADIINIYLCGIKFLRSEGTDLIDDTSLATRFGQDFVSRVNGTNTRAFRDHFALLIGLHTLQSPDVIEQLMTKAISSIAGAYAYPISIHHYFLVAIYCLYSQSNGYNFTNKENPGLSKQLLLRYIMSVVAYVDRYSPNLNYMVDCIYGYLSYYSSSETDQIKQQIDLHFPRVTQRPPNYDYFHSALASKVISIFDYLLCLRLLANIHFRNNQIKLFVDCIGCAINVARENKFTRIADALQHYRDERLKVYQSITDIMLDNNTNHEQKLALVKEQESLLHRTKTEQDNTDYRRIDYEHNLYFINKAKTLLSSRGFFRVIRHIPKVKSVESASSPAANGVPDETSVSLAASASLPATGDGKSAIVTGVSVIKLTT